MLRFVLIALIVMTTTTVLRTAHCRRRINPAEVLKRQLIRNQKIQDESNEKASDSRNLLIPSNSKKRSDESRSSEQLVDPFRTWSAFQRHAEQTRIKSKKNRRKKARKRLLKSSGRQRRRLLKELKGPAGPPGPRGPKGPPGAEISKEELVDEFTTILRDKLESKLYSILQDVNCSIMEEMSCSRPAEDSEVPSVVAGIGLKSAAFHSKLNRNFIIPRRTFLEVKYFQRPMEKGSFHRGETEVDIETGRYQISTTGIYQVSANIQIQHKALLGSKFMMSRKVKRSRTIRLLICIDGKCHNNSSLAYLTGLDSNSRIFTVSANGLLHLKKAEYISVFVDNSSRFKISLLDSSTFSGILLSETTA